MPELPYWETASVSLFIIILLAILFGHTLRTRGPIREEVGAMPSQVILLECLSCPAVGRHFHTFSLTDAARHIEETAKETPGAHNIVPRVISVGQAKRLIALDQQNLDDKVAP